MKSLTKISNQKEIAKLLGKCAMDVDFQESNIISIRPCGLVDVMIKADGVWFDTDSNGNVSVAY